MIRKGGRLLGKNHCQLGDRSVASRKFAQDGPADRIGEGLIGMIPSAFAFRIENVEGYRSRPVARLEFKFRHVPNNKLSIGDISKTQPNLNDRLEMALRHLFTAL